MSCGGLWSVGRILYGYGYKTKGPDGRLIGSLISHLGDLPLQIAVFKLCATSRSRRKGALDSHRRGRRAPRELARAREGDHAILYQAPTAPLRAAHWQNEPLAGLPGRRL